MKKFFNYVIPAVIGMLVTSCYIIVDGMFVGSGVGSDALAAVNLAFPPVFAATALTIIVSVGGSTLVSMNLGAGKKEEAIDKFNESIIFLVIMSILILLVGLIFAKPISYGLRAPDYLINDVYNYIKYCFLFSFPMVFSYGLNCFLRNDGAPRLSMISMVSGALTNIALDYVFIFIFKWGIIGAAIATGLGEVVSAAIAISYFLRKKGTLRFRKTKLSFNDLKTISKVGFPSFLTECTISVITMSFNLALLKHLGANGVASYSIMNYLITVINMIVLGIAQGMQPLVSFHYGSREEDKIKYYYKLAIKSGLVMTCVNYIINFFFGKYIISLFTTNEELITVTCAAFNLFNLGTFFAAINVINSAYFQAIKKSRLSTIICVLRGFVFVQLSLLTLPSIIGTNGIWLSSLSGEVLVFLVVRLFLVKTTDIFNSLDNNDEGTVSESI